MYKEPFVIAIASLSLLIAFAGCTPSPMAKDCSSRRTVIEGTIISQ